MRTDVLLMIPFQPGSGTFLDPHIRRTAIAHLNLPLLEARAQLERHLGAAIEPLGERWSGMLTRSGQACDAHRSATAVVLTTHLEAAGLQWEAVDPGACDLAFWRGRLEAALVLGGSYYSTSAREFLALEADVFCIGEGELRLPRIVRAIRDGRPGDLEAIAGLVLRRPDGGLRCTGEAAPLDLEALPAPDWRLAARIEPAARADRAPMGYKVETQRGCMFRCATVTAVKQRPWVVDDQVVPRPVMSLWSG